MFGYEDALEIVLRTVVPLAPQEVALDDSAGLVLAEDVLSDVDLPPFNKSAMDGYAVRSDDVQQAPATLRVVEHINAGQVPHRRVERGECAKIMTGAPLPEGADAVVMVEHTEPAGDDSVRILRTVPGGKNVCPRGEDLRQDQMAVRAGTVIRPAEVAVLAAAGQVRVRVYPRPTMAVAATGNEVVEVRRNPAPGQIRDSNSHSLPARLGRLGIRPDCLGIVRDEREVLLRAVEAGLQHDVFVVSGGVSMGDLDLVPGILRELRVELLFEKVAIKPGKPTVFGRRGRNVVFGLPGNPVSTLVIGELFLMPALRAMMGYPNPKPAVVRAVLEGPLSHKGDRRSYLPVCLRFAEGQWRAAPVEYHGSADIIGFARGNAVAAVPQGVKGLAAGERTHAIPMGEGLV